MHKNLITKILFCCFYVANKIVRELGSFILDANETVDKANLTKILAKLVLTNSFPLLKAEIAIKEDSEYILKVYKDMNPFYQKIF